MTDGRAIRAELARRELARRHFRDYLRYVHGAAWIETAMSRFLADRVQAFLEADTGHAYDVLLIETPKSVSPYRCSFSRLRRRKRSASSSL